MTNTWIEGIDWQRRPLFLTIAEAIARGLENGLLKDGESLPPHRECARQLGVALGTVTRAYAEAEKNGLLVGNRRNGTRIAAPRDGTASFGSLGRRPEGSIDLGINYPGPAEDPDPRAALQAIARRLDRKALLRYPPTLGHAAQREVYSHFLSTLGIEVGPERLALCGGAQHGIDLLLRSLFTSPAHLAIEALCYPGFLAAAKAQGHKLHPLALDAEGLVPGELEALCARTRVSALYCVPSFQNPSGAIMSETRKRELVAIARRHELLIIEDEIYRPLAGGAASAAFVELAPERSFLVSSLSKAVCGGLRAGAVAAPEAFMERVEQGILTSIWAASPLVFELMARWMEDGTIADTIGRRRSANAQRQDLAAQILGTVPNVELAAGRGNLFTWLSLPPGVARARVVAEALERGVLLAPSDLFVLPGFQAPEALRLSVSSPSTAESLELGLRRLAAILAELLPRPRPKPVSSAWRGTPALRS